MGSLELGVTTNINTILLAWFILVGVSITKSILRKQGYWTILLILNFLAGWFFPVFVVMWLPITYLILSRKGVKERKPKWWEWSIAILSLPISFIVLSIFALDFPLEVIMASFLIAFMILSILTTRKSKRKSKKKH